MSRAAPTYPVELDAKYKGVIYTYRSYTRKFLCKYIRRYFDLRIHRDKDLNLLRS